MEAPLASAWLDRGGQDYHVIVVLPMDQRAVIEEASRENAPLEACGLLIGRQGAEVTWITRAHATPNAAMEPEHSFVVPSGSLQAIIGDASRLGLAVVGSWHSHTSGSAVPSRADRAGAIDPDWLLLIASGDDLRVWTIGTDGTPRKETLARGGGSEYAPRP